MIAGLMEVNHRGPDNSGIWKDQLTGVWIGHTRLSIQDLSPTGHQPMVSGSGRYVLTFNGEIYNHKELKLRLNREFAGIHWRGNSDTEVLLNCFETYGVRKTLELTVGMFALGLWDRDLKELCLARDRIGEKPLYYGSINEDFVFCSELKSISRYPGWGKSLNTDALSLFFRLNYVPSPLSIYAGIHKVNPGCYVSYRFSTGVVTEKKYWDSASVEIEFYDENRSPFVSEDAIVGELERLLLESVRGQMISDVPLGSFLSGGIDSSVITALMQSISGSRVKTFSIGFHEAEHNEAGYAKAIAEYLGTDHVEQYVSESDAIGLVPSLAGIYDEPFADSSQIPTCLLSRLARQSVTVAVSGDGGDEVFGGYNHYKFAKDLWGAVDKLPYFARWGGGALLDVVPARLRGHIIRGASGLLPKRYRYERPEEKAEKLIAALKARTGEALHLDLMSHWLNESPVLLDRHGPLLPTINLGAARFSDLIERMMYVDMKTYLCDDIFVKVDRASMSSSLETRAPLVDHRLVEFMWALPLKYKMRNSTTKWALREVLHRYVPRELIDRPKKGFTVPLSNWLLGPLRPWAESLLDATKLNSDGILKPDLVLRTWQKVLLGDKTQCHKIWSILMFLAWKEEYLG